MMKRILEGLHTVEGVQGSLVVDGNGQILAYQAHALYDLSLLEQVSQTIVSTVDAVRLLHDEWDSLSASFSDGNLVLRNLKPGGAAAGRTVVLALIADARLNASFAGVAIRVATTKLKSLLESPNSVSNLGVSQLPSSTLTGGMATPPPGGTLSPHARSTAGAASAPASDLANSGLSWSGLGSSLSASGRSSEVSVADQESSTFLTACTKTLATSVGPMAKVFVKDAVRKLCPDRPFSRAQADGLISILRSHIDDPEESAQFQKKMRAHL
jgi:predicted regulator of Ras-like GTPase activity (Roadblock/LC7/MglB family)